MTLTLVFGSLGNQRKLAALMTLTLVLGVSAFTETDWRVARRKAGLLLQKMNLCGSRAIALDRDSLAQPAQLIFAGHALYLHPVSPGVFKSRITETVLQRAIICQQQEPFTIMIQAPNRIYVPDGNELGKGFPLSGKLAQYAIRFMKDDVAKSHPSD